ncbi:extracellular solute-binding protein [Paenibacillus sp. J5C_2022]|uniref:extracellular solute-binding protein n=1 Tax=Paenibacillus sp. J5C2022 TaxID=2977129 RepID=UPI0021D229F5|nr:extracellular solute-binding protein [Paenibacillus sp. J5C2022]MCU6709893.1 extracellular solute-binding protein [Paenibacillus sp. J5C2022]
MSTLSKMVKKSMVGSMVAVMALGATVACSSEKPKEPAASGAPEASSSASVAPSEAPITISMMVPQYPTEPVKADSPGMQKIREYTGYNIDINWVVGAGYEEKLNATIASGSMPQVLVIPDNKNANIVNAARSGMFWEVGPYLKDYPNLSSLNPQILSNTSLDGKIYGLPRTRPISRTGLLFRKDWLDNVGLKVPQTVDELYEVLKAFTYNDPDKNGKNDTFGLSDLGSASVGAAIDYLAIYFGAPLNWGVQPDGKLIPSFMTPEYLEAMKFNNKLYTEKLVNQDFLIVKEGYIANINQGKAGFLLTAVDSVTTAQFADLKKLNPQAELDVATGVTGPKGEFVQADPGFAGLLMFPKSSVKTEEDLKNILGFFDKMTDKQMIDLTMLGVEGHTYKMENGVPNVNKDLYNNEINPLNQFMVKLGIFGPKPGDTPMETKWKEIIAGNEKKGVSDPTTPLISQTNVEKGAQLKKQITDARGKFIMGELDEAGWQKAIETWQKNGGDQIIDEFTAEYAKINKK